MYITGNAGFLTAACNPNRIINTQSVLTIDGNTTLLDTKDIVSYKIVSASTTDKVFTPGNFVATRLEMSLISASEQVAKIDFKNAPEDSVSFYIESGVKVVTTMVYVPMGTFYPDKNGITVGKDGFVKIEASNIPPVLLTQFSSSTLSLPCTIKQALDKIGTETGMTIIASQEDFPNLGVSLIASFELATTYREALMYIAEVLGAYVCVGRDGKIYLRRLFNGLVDLGCVLDDNYIFDANKQETSVKPFQYIGIKAEKDDLGVTREVAGINTECRYDIIANPLTYGHPEDFLEGLVSPTSFTEFYPAKISFQGRPDIDAGDVLSYVYENVTYVLPVCKHTFEYNGGFKTTVESVGTDALNTSSVDSGVKTQITALKQNINTLYRDLSMTQSQITAINGSLIQTSSLLQTVDTLQSTISRIEGDLEKKSTVEQTEDSLRIALETINGTISDINNEITANQNTLLSYFDFQADGLVIGVSSSNIKLRLAHNKIQFLKDDVDEVAYISDGKLYITDAQFLRSLVLGNFEFVPRENGNLSLRRR